MSCLWAQHLTLNKVLVELRLCWDKGGKEEKKSAAISNRTEILHTSTLTGVRNVPRTCILFHITGAITNFNLAKFLFISALDQTCHYPLIHRNGALKQSRRDCNTCFYSGIC